MTMVSGRIRLTSPAQDKTHFSHDPFDVILRCAIARDARPQDRLAAVELHFRHPGDLTLVQLLEESGRDQPIASKAHDGEGRSVHDSPACNLKRSAQYLAHTSL